MSPLKISTRIDRQNPRHTRISVFQNGGLAGTLTVETEYAQQVIDRLTANPRRLEEALFDKDKRAVFSCLGCSRLYEIPVDEGVYAFSADCPTCGGRNHSINFVDNNGMKIV